jgi:hypothetical protein
MKTNRRQNRAKKVAAFIVQAERAFRRVARKVRAEHRKLGLAPVVWPNGKRSQRLRGSLKGTKSMDVLRTERKRERDL